MKWIDQPIVIVDVETTGGSPLYSRITEIACLRLEQGAEVSRFVSLVNPGQPIPLSIQRLTHILPHMVAEAPRFEDIAPAVNDIFDGAILVAHNARFDYSFLKAEMERAGIAFQAKLLCTARLSRALFPEYPRHNLSSLIDRYQLTCTARHRALGDTEALRDFLFRIEALKDLPRLEAAAKEITKRSYLSVGISEERIRTLPRAPGVYFLSDKDGALLYIGKSVNIRERVISHFSSTHKVSKDLRLWSETAEITFLETASDLGASLLELDQIKRLSPLYNRRSRRVRGLWYLIRQAAAPCLSFTLEKKASPHDIASENIYAVFKDKRQAKKSLETLIEEHGFCPKTFGLEKGSGPCFRFQLGKCSGACAGTISPLLYNARLENIFHQRKVRAWPHAGPVLIVSSTHSERKDFFLVQEWILQEAYTERGESLVPLFDTADRIFDYESYQLLSQALLGSPRHTTFHTHRSKAYRAFQAQKENEGY